MTRSATAPTGSNTSVISPAVVGIARPDILPLSEDFLEEVRRLPQVNLAAEALQRLLTDKIRVRMTQMQFRPERSQKCSRRPSCGTTIGRHRTF